MSERDELKRLFEEMNGMLSQFAEVARAHRARVELGIAAVEADALGDLEVEDEAPLSLAADDRPALAFPQIYEDDLVCVILGIDDDGPYAAHERGPALRLRVEGQPLSLAPGQERPLSVGAPPESIELIDDQGNARRLFARPV